MAHDSIMQPTMEVGASDDDISSQEAGKDERSYSLIHFLISIQPTTTAQGRIPVPSEGYSSTAINLTKKLPQRHT